LLALFEVVAEGHEHDLAGLVERLSVVMDGHELLEHGSLLAGSSGRRAHGYPQRQK
jgi:hypothetical protein